MSRQFLLFFLLSVFFLNQVSAQKQINFTSPDKKISISFWLNDEGKAFYNVSHLGEMVIKESKLGLEAQDADFVNGLKFVSESAIAPVKDNYELFTGKKRLVSYAANQKIIHLQSKEGRKLDIIFQLSNDGVAFRYYFPERSEGVRIINEEITSFHFDTAARAFYNPFR